MAVLTSMDEQNEVVSNKRKLGSDSNPKSKQKKGKKAKLADKNIEKIEETTPAESVESVETQPQVQLSPEELAERYPVLNDKELVKRFLAVPMTNNQKGRIRQALRQGVKGANDALVPDAIYGKMQAIIKQTENLTESDLRKLRILYNMLNNATTTKTAPNNTEKKKKKKNKKAGKKDKQATDNEIKVDSTDNAIENDTTKSTDKKDVEKSDDKNGTDKKEKVKGPKRYVVFVGNLVPDIEKEKLLSHFSELSDHIVDVRLPKREEGKKSSIAYIELKDEHSYELALSKHHTMLDNKRINVLYTTQKNSKISKSEAKSTAAKLVALQKSGKLIGSVAVNKKRTYRRNKAKRAIAKAAAESG
ncbi:uncharacterized protein LOC123704084 [Colias croceus]|uniref:uncharacterized protein LOC123704084 n=1 Tax=Colias crocea TaxID=72248 RepID=UPI001E28106F|nr:uncharacterized protein LOC123704084 [Colias croceus]